MDKKDLDYDLIRAAYRRDIKLTKKLLGSGANVNAKDSAGWTPLFWATWYSDTDFMKLLIDAGADVNIKSSRGATPLHSAVHSGRDPAELLIMAGADVNARDKDGLTPLYNAAAASGEYTDIIKLLIESGADVRIKDKLGKTPLCKAASGGHKDAMALIISAYPNIKHKKTNVSVLHPALCCAARMGQTDCMRLLIENGADIDACDTNGQTPAGILESVFPDLYAEHIDELYSLGLASRNLETEDLGKTVNTGFEFNI